MVGDWDLKQSALCCAVGDDTTVVVRPADQESRPIESAPLKWLAPSRFCLYEWSHYVVEGPAPLCVQLKGQPVKPLSGGLTLFSYANQIGQSVIRVQAGGQWLPPLPVEILSPKRPTPSEHLRFYRALLNDLVAWADRLPFTVAAPTGIPTSESPRPPTPLFVYHFLRQHDQELRAALTAILTEPHRALAEEELLMPLARAAEVDADVLLRILTQPEYLVPAREPVALATRLQGHAPTHIWQRLGRETFDTPENRFVRVFLRDLLRWTEALPTTAWLWDRAPDSAKNDLRDLAGHLRLALTDPLFDEVGEMAVFPAASQVLLRRYGYRELLALWRLFHLARRPFFDSLQTAIDARDIAKLYEFWCFFALAEAVAGVLGASPRWQLEMSDERGLEFRSSVKYFKNDKEEPYRLLYNWGFRQRTDRSGSYSVRLRPDFTLLHDNRIAVVFDAKFRLDTCDWAGEDDEAPNRQAKRADLYKMHTYRDALGARAAVALYPGNVTEFYDAETHVRRKSDMAEMLEKVVSEEWTGVGALQFSPETSKTMENVARETAMEGKHEQ